jgi:hypothetical protein
MSGGWRRRAGALLLCLAGTSALGGLGTSTSAVAADGAVGYMGCSMTRDTVTGYHTAGGVRLWETTNYSGGTLYRWESTKADRNRRWWDQFDALHAKHPDTTTVWWQLCMAEDEGDQTEERQHELALSILEQLRSRIGAMRVELSPMPMYTDGHVCPNAGPDGPRRMLELTNRLVREGHAYRGPDFPPLSVSQLEDRCHPNGDGQRILGGVLRQWYDGASPPAPADDDLTAPTSSEVARREATGSKTRDVDDAAGLTDTANPGDAEPSSAAREVDGVALDIRPVRVTRTDWPMVAVAFGAGAAIAVSVTTMTHRAVTRRRRSRATTPSAVP